MPPLDRAVALEQMNGVALRIGEDLYLDVPRAANGLLNECRGIAERTFCLAHGCRYGLPEHRGVIDPAHAAATAAGNRLDEHGKADLLGAGHQLIKVCRRRRGPKGGDASSPRCLDSTHLVAGELENSGGRTDEDDARFVAGAGQARVFAQEAIAGIDRVGTRTPWRPG